MDMAQNHPYAGAKLAGAYLKSTAACFLGDELESLPVPSPNRR